MTTQAEQRERADILAGDIEGDIDVKLAPVSGPDTRRQLPRDLFKKVPLRFALKFAFAWLLIFMSWVVVATQQAVLPIAGGILCAGLMYAHLVELQHECLHGHAFRSPLLNRLFGVACGIFMFSSHSHYRYDHLRHHANLGTPENREHFVYRFQNLHSLIGFLRAFFDLSRYPKLLKIVAGILRGLPVPDVDKASYQRHIKQEYLFFVAVALGALIWSILAGSYLLVWVWLLPAMLISEGTHFLIEMPEHFGLNTQTNSDTLSNTRTIQTHPFFSWFVNGNNFHTAHHYHQGVPMCNVEKLDETIRDRTTHLEKCYRSFYWKVLKGRIRQPSSQTCMPS